VTSDGSKSIVRTFDITDCNIESTLNKKKKKRRRKRKKKKKKNVDGKLS
jgi:hypothetical protein